MRTALFATLVLSSFASGQPFTSEETHEIIQALGLYERLIAKQPDLWPAFDPKSIPLAIYRPRAQTIVVGHPKPPTGRSMPSAGRAARVITTPQGWLGAGPVPLGEVLCGRLDPALLADASAPILLAEMVREAFRAHQQGASKQGIGRGPLPADVFSYPDNDVQNDAALEIESILLEKTLADEDAPARLARAKELCDLRRDRRGRLKPEILDFEEATEVAAGVPIFVAVRALRVAVGLGLLSTTQAAEGIEHLLASSKSSPDTTVVRRLALVTARTALLLDSLAPEWRAGLQDGRPLQGLLEKAAGACAGAAAVRQRLGFAALFAESQRRVRDEWKRRELDWGHIDAAGGRGVVSVELAPFVDMGAQELEFATAQRIDGNRRTHQRLRVDLAQAGGLLFDQPVGEDRAQKRYVTSLAKSAKVIVDGDELRLDLSDERPFLEAIVMAPGIELVIHGGLLHVHNGGVRVRPFPRGGSSPAGI